MDRSEEEPRGKEREKEEEGSLVRRVPPESRRLSALELGGKPRVQRMAEASPLRASQKKGKVGGEKAPMKKGGRREGVTEGEGVIGGGGLWWDDDAIDEELPWDHARALKIGPSKGKAIEGVEKASRRPLSPLREVLSPDPISLTR